ncbi:hypothetical protein NS115_16255 [Paenibacillus jamilae]|uniref:Uncharacterized protein n=1 Tax=Paenibacillus jamilae TaxID=114136 RepID=A0ACC4ZSP2_9BACL|nr:MULTISPECIES: hypothetical protein [Paenibacillus]AUO08529.1 hypothetical protein C0638_19165 [Paenibacillus sp. lzh-N1]KTS81312.1 hypothetical protein NS115_16255 [Paenibacillus jamilae]
MGPVIIRSVDDATYLKGPVDFSEAFVSGLALEVGSINGLENKLRDLRNDIDKIHGDLFNGLIVNATFDPGSRNLKLFSQGKTVATVNIPAGGSSSSSTK